MSRNNPFQIGRGSKVRVAKLPLGSRGAIPEQTITLGAAATAGATTLTVAPLTEPIFASTTNPVYLAFDDAVEDIDKFVKITADAADGATSLTVAPLGRAIANASTAEYPVRLQARTSADISTTANDVTTSTFDTLGYSDGITSQIGYSVSCPGNFLALDAGFKTCFEAFNEFLEVWLSIELPAPGGYARGYIFRGAASVTNAPIATPADGIITANFDFTFRGKLDIIEPAVA